jgi:hypothetical protein
MVAIEEKPELPGGHRDYRILPIFLHHRISSHSATVE